MGSGAVVYIPSFREIGSGIQKLIGGTHTQLKPLYRTEPAESSPHFLILGLHADSLLDILTN
jgi:hypothetical protein